MNTMTMWLRVCVVVIGLACVVTPNAVRAADDDDNRDRPTRIERPMPGRECSVPQTCPLMPRAQRCPYACRILTGVALWLAVIHVLLASWVFTDIRKRSEGHGIFVVLALLAGIPGTILYALVRIGDAKKT
jgi:hypothetical protein